MNFFSKKTVGNKLSIFEFQNNNELENRKLESEKIIKKYPDKVPIICELTGFNNDFKLDKKKFLVPCNINISQFSYIIRKRIKLKKTDSIFIFTEKNELPTGSVYMSELYNNYKNEDGFLYIKISEENTFG